MRVVSYSGRDETVRGAIAEVRALFDAGDYAEAISACNQGVPQAEGDELFKWLLLKACAQCELGLYAACLETLKDAGPLSDTASLACKARFHAQRAYASIKLDRKDHALIDYEEARYWAQRAGDDLTVAAIRNNLAKVYSALGRIDEAISESDAAIEFMRTMPDPVYLGKAFDQRAQILNEHSRYEEAIKFCERALTLLCDHPSANEAQATYGRALVGLGSSYLSHPDPVEDFRMRRAAVNAIDRSVGADLIKVTLERSNGNVKQAAALLGIAHPSLLAAIKRNKMTAHQRVHLRRSLIKK